MSHSLRTVLTIAAGSMVLFVWGALSHLIIIRGVGFTALPDDGTLAHALVGDHVEPGLYVFPAPPGWRGEPTTKTSMAAWDARFREGPSGLIVIRPRGEGPFGARKLLVQLLADVIAVSLALLVVRSIRASFWLRVTCVAALGVGGFVKVGVIYWNWYAFTDTFIVAQGCDMLVGWLLVGCTLAALAGSRVRSRCIQRIEDVMETTTVAS